MALFPDSNGLISRSTSDESSLPAPAAHATPSLQVIAAAVLFIGLLWSVWISVRDYRRRRDGGLAYRVMRQSFGGAILLGLEILVAGDLIRTVAVAPALDNVIVLGVIVLIRTFLSFSLEIEIDGVPPWRKGLVSGASVMARAAAASKPTP